MGRVFKGININTTWSKFPHIEIDGKIFNPRDNEVRFANLLKDSSKFHGDLGGIRKIINLKKLEKYPNPSDPESIVYLFSHINDGLKVNIENSAKLLLKKIGLPQYWLIPLEVVILTHTLPVPQIESSFIIFQPKNKIPLPFVNQVGYPSIIMQQNFSHKEIHDYIDTNWPELERISRSLPKKPGIFRTTKMWLVKGMIFLFKEYEGMDSREIAIFFRKNQKVLGLTKKEIKSICYKPDFTYIRIGQLYNEYKKHILSIYP